MKRLLALLLAVAVAGLTAAAAQSPAGRAASTPAIPGVVAAGTPIVLVKDGFDGTEGPLPQADGGLLFTENRAGRIVRLSASGEPSVYLARTGGANSLALTRGGELVAALTATPSIAVLREDGSSRVLASAFEGAAFGRPNDLTVDRAGRVYFSDPGAAPPGQPRRGTAVYRVDPDGRIERLAADIALPNGVALSPDEHTLYVADTAGPAVLALKLGRQGEVRARREFAQLQMPPAGSGPPLSGADGLAVDARGRLYVATTVGVQVFSPRGAPLGVIVLPQAPQNLAFAGPKRASLFVVGRGAVYRIDTRTRGPHRPGK
jgi:gluconolactonase